VWMDQGMGSYDHILIQDKRCFDEGFFSFNPNNYNKF
jgi:hypothetical protein